MKGETNYPLQLVRVWPGCLRIHRFFICARTCIYKMHLHGYADYYTRSSPPCDHTMHLHRYTEFPCRRDTETVAKCFYDLGNKWMNKAASFTIKELQTWFAEIGIKCGGNKDTRIHRRVALILFLSLHICGNGCGAERPKWANRNQHSGKFISMHITFNHHTIRTHMTRRLDRSTNDQRPKSRSARSQPE